MDDALDVIGIVVVAAESIRDCSEPEVAGDGAHVGLDDDVVTLTHADAVDLVSSLDRPGLVHCKRSYLSTSV